MMEEPEAPRRKRAKQPALKTTAGDELRSLTPDGEPIVEGVPNEDVRMKAEDYSLAMWRYGQSKIDHDSAKDLLIDAMHSAGIESCVARDSEGIAFRFVLKNREGIKREKLKNGEDE